MFLAAVVLVSSAKGVAVVLVCSANSKFDATTGQRPCTNATEKGQFYTVSS